MGGVVEIRAASKRGGVVQMRRGIETDLAMGL